MPDIDDSKFEVYVTETGLHKIRPKRQPGESIPEFMDRIGEYLVVSDVGVSTPDAPLDTFSEYVARVNKCLHKQEADPHGKNPHEPGAKMDLGKVQAGVLLDFSRALWKVAEVGTYGANKYTRGGWQEVPDGQQRYLDAMMRHLCKMPHEPIDEESGLLTLAQVAWNALAILELELRKGVQA